MYGGIGGKNVRKLVKLFVVLFLILIIVQAGFFIFERVRKERDYDWDLRGELRSVGILVSDPLTGVEFPEDCSNENLTALWSSIFFESFSGANIVNNSDCSRYVLYKNVSVDNFYVIMGYSVLVPPNISHVVFASYGSLTDDAKNNLSAFDGNSIDGDLFGDFMEKLIYDGLYYQGARDISSISEASSEFLSIFDLDEGSWEELDEGYTFDDKGAAFINRNKTQDLFFWFMGVLAPLDLTQTQPIPDRTLYGSEYHGHVFYLGNYFANLGYNDSDLSFSYALSSPGAFEVIYDMNFFHALSFNTSSTFGEDYSMNVTFSYPGLGSVTSNNFNVSIYGCLDSDDGQNILEKGNAENRTNIQEDYCVDNNTVMEYYCSNELILGSSTACSSNYYCENGACSENEAPDFRGSSCGDLMWEMNTTYVLDMEDCFDDEEDDDLAFRYEYPSGVNSSNSNVTVAQNGSELTLTPRQNWAGEGKFYIYANDSITETRGKVDFFIANTSSPGNGNGNGDNNASGNDTNGTNGTVEEFRIMSPRPSGTEVSIFSDDEKNFSVRNTDYDSIEWFLDGNSVGIGLKSYVVKNLSLGNHTLEVKIIKGSESISKTWQLTVEEGFESGSQRLFDIGKVILYTVIIIVVIVIVLVVWMFMGEKKRKSRKPAIGFGITVVSNKKSDQSSNYLPGR